jgi:hypothetical protein
MKLKGSIQGKEALILVDSGSTNTFVSKQFAAELLGIHALTNVVKVQVANGSILTCDSFIPQAQWSMDEYSFTSDMKIIDLQHFDMILGMDRLEQFSPMKVHWKHKWLSIPYNGSTSFLQGIVPHLPEEIVVHVCAIIETDQNSASEIHPAVAAVLDDFALLFQSPTELPPERDCDHVIPLVPSAKPVHIRPYRYPPSLKDEIEKQVADMLAKGIILPSSSAFSSPILLVKKKRWQLEILC